MPRECRLSTQSESIGQNEQIPASFYQKDTKYRHTDRHKEEARVKKVKTQLFMVCVICLCRRQQQRFKHDAKSVNRNHDLNNNTTVFHCAAP